MAESFSLSGAVKALRKRFSATDTETRAEGAREASEEASKVLPAKVMPRAAILKKRKQLQDLDEATKGD